VTEAVIADVGVEMQVVAAAERGALSDRAAQALSLNQLDASPLQVEAADQLLHSEPLGSLRLWTTTNPAAACVATHWLAAAADIAAGAAGIAPSAVFSYADEIEAVPVEVPSRVVEAITGARRPPREIVLDLLADAAAPRRPPTPPGGMARPSRRPTRPGHALPRPTSVSPSSPSNWSA
jgi:hypothetical protein